MGKSKWWHDLNRNWITFTCDDLLWLQIWFYRRFDFEGRHLIWVWFEFIMIWFMIWMNHNIWVVDLSASRSRNCQTRCSTTLAYQQTKTVAKNSHRTEVICILCNFQVVFPKICCHVRVFNSSSAMCTDVISLVQFQCSLVVCLFITSYYNICIAIYFVFFDGKL